MRQFAREDSFAQAKCGKLPNNALLHNAQYAGEAYDFGNQFPPNANFFSDKNLVSDYFSWDNPTHNRTCHWAAAFNLIF